MAFEKLGDTPLESNYTGVKLLPLLDTPYQPFAASY